MLAAESYTSRHYIAIVAMACLCVLLGGPSYAAGAESLIIAGATYYEPGVSGPGWAWTDADHLELNGYAGGAIGAEGDLVLTLAGQNSVTESHAPDADITLCGMEAWGNLTLRGTGTLTATGSQCGIHVSQALVVDGCTVDARADGDDITDEAVAGVIAGDMAVRGGGRVVAAGAGSGACVRAYGVYLQDAGIGFHDSLRFHKHRCTGRGNVMDDAAHFAAVFALDRDNIAAVAHGDHTLLQIF